MDKHVGLAGDFPVLQNRAPAQPIEPVLGFLRAQHVTQSVAFTDGPDSQQHGDQSDLVVAQDVATPARFDELTHAFENPQIVGPPVHQVPHRVQDELIAKFVAQPSQQFIELVGAALDITDENVLG